MLATFEKDMGMIFHQHPSKDGAFPFSDLTAQSVKESLSIMIVQEDRGPVDSPHHDMMQSTRDIESGLPGHERNLPKCRDIVKSNATYATTSLMRDQTSDIPVMPS